MLLNSKMARLVAGCLSYLGKHHPSQELYIEENPGMWVEVRTTDDPEVQIRIDSEDYSVKYRVDIGSWHDLPFKLEA